MFSKEKIEESFAILLDKGKSLEPLRQAKQGHERELLYLKKDAVLLMAQGKNPVELQKAVETRIRNCEEKLASIATDVHSTFGTWVSQLRESADRYARDVHGPQRVRLKLLCAEAAGILTADAAAAKEFRASVVFLHKLREQLAIETQEGTGQYPIPEQGALSTIPEPANEYFVRRDFTGMIAYLAQQL